MPPTQQHIDIIIGPMFSGKSTELLRRCGRLSSIGKRILYINHTLDTRTDDSIQTHNKVKVSAIKVSSLFSVSDELYNDADVIGIDEAQFFPDLYNFVLQCEKDGKTVILSGLDGDSNRRPFGQILDCIPLCDSVVKLTAMDMMDKDGSEAIFTARLNTAVTSDQVCIGAEDSYASVSRKNYLKFASNL
jgi:thymidine kinase